VAADPDNERAEYAIVVRDDIAGRARHAADGAHARLCGAPRIKEVFGDVLAENKRMLDIARRLDFTAERCRLSRTSFA